MFGHKLISVSSKSFVIIVYSSQSGVQLENKHSIDIDYRSFETHSDVIILHKSSQLCVLAEYQNKYWNWWQTWKVEEAENKAT